MEFTNQIVALSSDEQKASFYRKTYLHVAMAILAFVGVETFLIAIAGNYIMSLLTTNKMVWLFVIGGMWLGSFLANRWTMSQSRAVQYGGLTDDLYGGSLYRRRNIVTSGSDYPNAFCRAYGCGSYF